MSLGIPSEAVSDNLMTLERWILDRLQMATENISDRNSKPMLELAQGELLSLMSCLSRVRITTMHDELWRAYKGVLKALDKKSPSDAAGLRHLAYFTMIKLQAEKCGDWQLLERRMARFGSEDHRPRPTH